MEIQQTHGKDEDARYCQHDRPGDDQFFVLAQFRPQIIADFEVGVAEFLRLFENVGQ